MFVLRNGCRWRDAPKDYGPHKTIYTSLRWPICSTRRATCVLLTKGSKLSSSHRQIEPGALACKEDICVSRNLGAERHLHSALPPKAVRSFSGICRRI